MYPESWFLRRANTPDQSRAEQNRAEQSGSVHSPHGTYSARQPRPDGAEPIPVAAPLTLASDAPESRHLIPPQRARRICKPPGRSPARQGSQLPLPFALP